MWNFSRRMKPEDIKTRKLDGINTRLVRFLGFGGCMTLLGVYGSYSYFSHRERSPPSVVPRGESALGNSEGGNKKHVIIAGAGPGGCALASSLISNRPELRVTVFDPVLKHELKTHWAYACAGRRTYDVNKIQTGNFLVNTSLWCVPPAADLRLTSIEEVLPEKNRVIDSNGVSHQYDYLVLATGAKPKLSVVTGLTEKNANSGVIGMGANHVSDSLSSLTSGQILMVKVNDENPSKNESTPQKRSWWSFGNKKSLSSSASSVEKQQQSSAELLVSGSEYSRQAEGNFISTVNAVWKSLSKHKGFDTCPFSVITEDSTPSDRLPDAYNDQVKLFWRRRNLDYISGQKLESVDTERRIATFRDKEDGTITQQKFKFMYLDLPSEAPSFIAKSGLSSSEKRGFVDVDQETLIHNKFSNIFALGDTAALKSVKSYGAVFSQVPVVAYNLGKRFEFDTEIDLRKKKLEKEAMKVNREAGDLKDHLSRNDVLGDQALTATLQKELQAVQSSAAETLKQVTALEDPEQVSQEFRDRVVKYSSTCSSSKQDESSVGRQKKSSIRLQKYNGYSSFHITMTTWRCMWPEMVLTPRSQNVDSEEHSTSVSSFSERRSASFAPLEAVDNHFWNNSQWRGPQGFHNGIFLYFPILELPVYELFYWYWMLRGYWHPPTWSKVPAVVDRSLDL